MNSIIKSGTTYNLLKRHKILPDSWAIPDSEVARIINSDIGLLSIFSPAANLAVSSKYDIDKVKNLITFNASFLEGSIISGRQIVSIILHEIGHILNSPIPRPHTDVYYMNRSTSGTSVPVDEEIYADDYARYCGYGCDFANALSIMRNRGEFGFNCPTIQIRIDRLKNPSQELLLNFN
jgi:hypothetical protein